MTLKEWSTITQIKVTGATADVKTVILDREISAEDRWHLYHLEDHAVSSVGGLVVWLTPKTTLVS